MKTNNYRYYMNRLPIEVRRHIYDFDPTYTEMYKKVIRDLQTKMMWYWCNQGVIRDSFVSYPVVASDFYINEFTRWRERTFSRWYFDRYCVY